jgi:hypothetical protein
MTSFARGVRIGTLVLGLAAMTSACAQLSEDDQAMLAKTQQDAAAAQAAADRASAAADRAAAAAAEAADAASAAKMAMEQQDRMLQKTMRK